MNSKKWKMRRYGNKLGTCDCFNCEHNNKSGRAFEKRMVEKELKIELKTHSYDVIGNHISLRS